MMTPTTTNDHDADVVYPDDPANPDHRGEVFTPRPVVERLFELLEEDAAASGSSGGILVDPCAGLGQFAAVYLDRRHTPFRRMVCIDRYPENVAYIQRWLAAATTTTTTGGDGGGCVSAVVGDGCAATAATDATVVVANPPFEDYAVFLYRTFIDVPRVRAAAFIVPGKWAADPALVAALKPSLRAIQLLPEDTFERTGSRKITRVVSGTCILVLRKPDARDDPEEESFVLYEADGSVCRRRSVPRDLGGLRVLPCRADPEAFALVGAFRSLAARYPCRAHYLSQYHFFVHAGRGSRRVGGDFAAGTAACAGTADAACRPLPAHTTVVTSRRQRIAGRAAAIPRDYFRDNTYRENPKVLLNTSNECQNGHVRAFPVYRAPADSVFTASFLGFWTTTTEAADVFAGFLELPAVRALFALVKRTQNLNSTLLFEYVPFITTATELAEADRALAPFLASGYVASFPGYEHRRPYDTSRFPRY